jgi:hypothetical protein
MRSPQMVMLLGCGCLSLAPWKRAKTITQEEFLDQLKQVHPIFEKEEISSRIEKENRSSLLGAQDWNLLSSISFAHEEPAIAIGGPERTYVFSLSGGVERSFWTTG